MRLLPALLACVNLGVYTALSQSPGQGDAVRIEAPPSGTNEVANLEWSFGASVYAYLVPQDRDYAQPTVTVDRGPLHLEARYNYESLDTGSAWVGYNLSGGKTLTWALTPMVGGVFGGVDGIAPGYKGSLGWWKLELYSEGEFVFDFDGSSGSFFYNWSELTIAPVEWLRVGLVTQRTRAYDSDRDIQRGFLVGFSDERVSLTACVFNPDDARPTVVLSVAVSF